MVTDIIKYNDKEFQLSTIKVNFCFETMIFPIENGTALGNEVYCFRTVDPGESQNKHKDIYYHPERYVSDEAISEYLKKKENMFDDQTTDVTDIIDIKLNAGETGYDVIGEYIRRYWNHNSIDTVIVAIGTSYDGKKYDLSNIVASPFDGDNIEFLHDWWEGETYIKLFGIKSIDEIDISGGIYIED